jgi:hypothetical protein
MATSLWIPSTIASPSRNSVAGSSTANWSPPIRAAQCGLAMIS